MLHDLLHRVQTLFGDSSKRKQSTKPISDPLRHAMNLHGGKQVLMQHLQKDIEAAWNVGFAILVTSNGVVWKLPGDNLFAMYRTYLKALGNTGGSSLKDIVQHLECGVVIMHVEPMNVGAVAHMCRAPKTSVLRAVRDFRGMVQDFNRREKAEYDAGTVTSKVLRPQHHLSFRVMAYDGDKVYRNAILR